MSIILTKSIKSNVPLKVYVRLKMSDDQKSSFVRFVTPLVLLVIGLFTIITAAEYGTLTVAHVETIGFGLFTVGALTFTLIYNHARNPLATDDIIVNVSQALVVYGGVLTALVYQGIFGVSMMIIAVTSVMIIGILISATIEVSGVEAEDVQSL